MSDRLFTLLLSLILQDVCAEFQVWTLLQYNHNSINSVNIICQHDAQETWVMGARVINKFNNTRVCSMDSNQFKACKLRKEGNQFNFTLDITAEQKGLPYQCEVFRHTPLPIILRTGQEIKLFPGHESNHSCNYQNVSNDCSQATSLDLFTWVLLGFVILLCLYSLMITIVFIKLRLKISEELTVTYVPMQRKMKGHGADKNAEYMDMRKVHHKAQPPRDMNHNSHVIPVGSVV